MNISPSGLSDYLLRLLADANRKGFFHLLCANAIIGFLGFGSQILVAKILTPVEVGQIKVIQSFISVATILAGFGFSTSVLKICSEKRPLEERAAIFKKCIHYSIVPIVAVVIGLLILAKTGLLSPDPAVNKWLPLYALSIPAVTVVALIMVYLQALKKIQLMATTQVIIRLAGYVVLVVMTYYYGLGGFIVSTILIGYVALLPLLRLVRNDLKKAANVCRIFSQSFYYAKWSVAGLAIATIAKYMDIFMLNYLTKDREGFGYYGLASIFVLGLSYITATVQSISIPYFSEKMEDKVKFLIVLKKYTKLLVLLSLGTSIIAFLIVPPFIEFFYGQSYRLAGVYFRLLLLKYFFWSCSALPSQALIGLGKIKYNCMIVVLFLPISMLLSYVFISLYGMKGAAAAQAVAYFIKVIISYYIIRYVVKFHFNALTTGSYPADSELPV